MIKRSFVFKFSLPIQTVDSYSVARCPICKRPFCRNNEHKICTFCTVGMVWTKNGYCYYKGLDQTKQKEFGV